MSIIDFYFFIVFLFGICQSYILYSIKDYYKQLQTNILRKIEQKKSDLDEGLDSRVIQIFNLASHFIIIIGWITPYWWIFVPLFGIIFIGNQIKTEVKFSTTGLKSNLKKSKIITYSIVILKVIGLFVSSILYFHSFI